MNSSKGNITGVMLNGFAPVFYVLKNVRICEFNL
jgi:hypothetical protein